MGPNQEQQCRKEHYHAYGDAVVDWDCGPIRHVGEAGNVRGVFGVWMGRAGRPGTVPVSEVPRRTYASPGGTEPVFPAGRGLDDAAASPADGAAGGATADPDVDGSLLSDGSGRSSDAPLGTA